MTEAYEEVQTNEPPLLNACYLVVRATGLSLLNSRQEAEATARTSGAELWRYSQPGKAKKRLDGSGEIAWVEDKQEAHFSGPDGRISADDTGTQLEMQLRDGGDTLTRDLEGAANLLTGALGATGDPGTLEALRIRFVMNADRPPPGMEENAPEPAAGTFLTEDGVRLQHSTNWWRSDLSGEEEELGESLYNIDIFAESVVSGPDMPTEEQLLHAMMATYSVAGTLFLRDFLEAQA